MPRGYKADGTLAGKVYKKGDIPWTKGKGHSDKSKQKMSETRKGKRYFIATEFKKGIHPKTEIKKGQHLSPKTQFKKGHTPWSKGKHPEYLQGRNHPAWKGGKGLHIYGFIQYKVWRSKVFERDNWTCQTCYKRGCYLEAHHIKRSVVIIDQYNLKTSRDAIKCKELWDINNGVTLCEDCHNLTKRGRKRKLDLRKKAGK